MTWKAHAKINLFLKVTGRLKNGFHRLDTVFQEIDLHDEIIWEPAPEKTQELSLQQEQIERLELRVLGAELGSIESNLVYRAAKLFEEASKTILHGKLTLLKRIPHGGGLGGGSSDAACTLLNLNRFYNNPLSHEQLHHLACKLGSDVPFFLLGSTCRGKGRGEILEKIRLPRTLSTKGFLFLPPSKADTVEVYNAYSKDRPSTWTSDAVCSTNSQNDIQWGFNDLTVPACSIYQDMDHMDQVFRQHLAGEQLFMSGSGSTWVWLTEKEDAPVLPFEFQVKVLPFHFF